MTNQEHIKALEIYLKRLNYWLEETLECKIVRRKNSWLNESQKQDAEKTLLSRNKVLDEWVKATNLLIHLKK